MSPTEVLGIEIRQYVGGGLSTHIPRVIGHTSETLTKNPQGVLVCDENGMKRVFLKQQKDNNKRQCNSSELMK